MEGESGVTRSIIDEFYFWDIQGDQMEGESCLTRSITNELHSWDIQRDQMEAESFDGEYLHFSVPVHLPEISIFRTNLFFRGILSIRGVYWITTFVKIPVFPN